MLTEKTLLPTRPEHVPLAVFAHRLTAACAVAAEVAGLIRARQRQGRTAVLGLATGSTPVRFYAELVRLHREERLSFANVITFNLDEYRGLTAGHPRSYGRFMRRHLFDPVDLPEAQIHLLDGAIPDAAVDAHCREYEEKIRAAGGIDFQILGIGRNGHIGFNEPGSARASRTRLVALDPLTRRDAAGDFGGEEYTPRCAITMGIGTILEARRIVLMAWGRDKAGPVRAAVEGEVTIQAPASFLQDHDRVQFVLDHDAAGALTRHHPAWRSGARENHDSAPARRMIRRGAAPGAEIHRA